MSKLHAYFAQMPMVSKTKLLYYNACSTNHVYIASCGLLYDWLTVYVSLQPGLLMILHVVKESPRSQQLQSYNILLRHLLGTPAKGNLTVVRTSCSKNGHTFS